MLTIAGEVKVISTVAAKSTLEAVHAQQQLHQAQLQLTQAETEEHFSAQADAIKTAAAAGILNAQQEATKLRSLYQQERDDRIRTLQEQLTAQEALVAKTSEERRD